MNLINWKKVRRGAIATLQSFILLGGCFAGVAQSQPSDAEAALKTLGVNQKQLTGTKQTQKAGKLRVVYEQSSNEINRTLQQGLKEVGYFEGIVNNINNLGLMLPNDIPVVIRDCQEVNAYYDPTANSIIMCNELMMGMASDFYQRMNVSEDKALESGLQSSVFVFYHELGHALIDVLNLPTTGKEEDTVDEFATILLTSTKDKESARIVLNAAKWFGLYKNSEVPAWAEHAPNEQRVYNIVCLVYGSNPQQFSFLLQQTEMPQERGAACASEYDKKVASWEQLLTPHMAQGNKAPISPQNSAW
jgi:hypothetical protein